MSTEELSAKDQLDFATVYGSIFSLETTVEYLQMLQGLMAERKAKYARNKANEAEAACATLLATLRREMTKRMNPEQKAIQQAAIEHHKEFIHNFFMFDDTDRRRIESLMNKIKKERDVQWNAQFETV